MLKKGLTSVSLLTLAFFLVSVCFVPAPAQANYTSVTLSPATGTIYGTSTAIGVYVNSGSDEFAGVDINIAFTGSASYLNATGASRCTSFNVTEGTGTINVECLSLNHDPGETYSGLVGTLYFKSTAEGTSVFTITSVDPETVTTTGGTYTLSISTAPTDGEDLPDSGLFDDSLGRIVLGSIFLIIGILCNKIPDREYNLLGKVNEMKERRKEENLEKRRERWEKKF